MYDDNILAVRPSLNLLISCLKHQLKSSIVDQNWSKGYSKWYAHPHSESVFVMVISLEGSMKDELNVCRLKIAYKLTLLSKTIQGAGLMFTTAL